MDWITIGAAIRVATIWGLQIERERGKKEKRESQRRRSRTSLGIEASWQPRGGLLFAISSTVNVGSATQIFGQPVLLMKLLIKA